MTQLNRRIPVFLIAATILISSVFVAQESFGNNKDNSDQSPSKYEVEILSKEKIDEAVIDGIKVVQFRETIRLINIPTEEDLLSDNKEYLDQLEDNAGKEAADRKRQQIRKIADNMKEEITIDVVKVGNHSITFGVETYDSPNGNIKDPVNMLWYDSGYASNVEGIIDDYADHGWEDATGGTQYVYIDNTEHGGIAYWQEDSYQLQEGEFLETRYHVRVFDGSYDGHGTYGEWSVGGVHKETWDGSCSCHKIDSDGWEVAEDELKNDMDGKTGVGTISSNSIGNDGTYQGEENDGYAVYMQLT